MRNCAIILFLTFSCLCSSAKEALNPVSYGVLSAKTGVGRYKCLLKCHNDAVSRDAAISYEGIKSLIIEIPSNAQSIPLTDDVDFAGVEMTVLNNQKSFNLFSKKNRVSTIQVSKESIDNGDFSNVEALSKGGHVLCIEDTNPWIETREGYDYGATRKESIYVVDGKARNRAVTDYNNEYSSPKAYYFDEGEKTTIRNIVFNRDAASSKITNLFSISNQCDLTLEDIVINTPQDNDIYGDATIQINNSSVVLLKNIRVNGTYSLTNMYGYGFKFNNVSNLTCESVYARARWGVFGTNNMNGVLLKDCDINRFDVHCYGRDIKSVRCKFTDLYNQFSSIYGEIEFDECEFSNCIPVLMESSYNAYTSFDIIFKDCVFNLKAKKNYLITLFGLTGAHNSRPELYRKSIPNVTVSNCTVNLTEKMGEWHIIETGNVSYRETLDYMSYVTIENLIVNKPCNMDIFSTRVRTTNPLKVEISKAYYVQEGKLRKFDMRRATVDEKASVRCNGKMVTRK